MKWDRQKIILAVLVVVGIPVVYWVGFRQPAPPAVAGGSSAHTGAQAGHGATPGSEASVGAGSVKSRFESDTVNVADLLASVKEVDFDYDKSKPSRDPMTPLVGAFAKAQGPATESTTPGQGPNPALIQAARGMKLTGIMWDEKHPLAVVDNTVVGLGYKFSSGITVDSITQSQIILNVQGRKIPLELKEQ